jgi:signal transduction histidine kinase
MDRPLDHLPTVLRGRPFVVDSLFAGAVVLTTVLFPSTAYWPDQGISFLIGLALTVPLAWRRRAPIPAAAFIIAAAFFEVAATSQFLVANVAALLMVYALAAYAPQWAGRAGLVIGLFGALVAALRYFSANVGDALIISAGYIAVAVVAAWALGNVRRARIQRVASLEERAHLLDLERDQEMRLAATTERARIARELHDVVAHSLSVVIAQADGGRYAGKTDPGAATGALDAIAATGRQALTDMRALLGVLRDGGGEEYAPQPDVSAIPALVEDVRTSGLDVDLIVEGLPQDMPAGPQLAAYRIVQESLTNVLKHAGPASRAWVRLQWRPEALEVAVLDDGRGAAAAVAEADGPVLTSSGHGLLGMRERAELHGGRLTAAPRHGGGFGVHALLPYRAVR